MSRERSQTSDRRVANRTDPQARRGTLFIIGTPIGNPDDLTVRALAVLKRVTIVASETPRATQVLLDHHRLRNTITSYGPHNVGEKIAVILMRLNQGHDIAIVSDNGMPVLYDPGRLLVSAAHRAGFTVTVVPGPSAFTAATALSGFSGDRLVFEGRLPPGTAQVRRFLRALKQERRTTSFYLPAERVCQILSILCDIVPTRSVMLAVDLTKSNEVVYRGNPRTVLTKVGTLPSSADCTIVVAGKTRRPGSTPRRADG